MQHLTFYPLTLGTDGQPSVATLYLLYMQIPHTNQEEGGKEKEDGAAQHLQIVAIIYTLFKNGKGTLWKQIKRVGKIGRF